MSARGLTPELAATLQLAFVPEFALLQLDFDSGTVRLAGTDFNIEWDGYIWLAARQIGTIDTLTETADGVEGLRFTMSGVSDESLADVQQEQYQGRAVTVLWCFLDGSTLHVDPTAWQGRLDVPEIDLEATTATISVTAEHRMADWQRPRQLMFNHADQQRIDPMDDFFLDLEAMDNADIVVFSRESQMQ